MTSDQEIQQASKAALLSIGNLTFLPGLGFLILLLMRRGSDLSAIGRYHVDFGIRLNLWAFAALILVSGLMVLAGGFSSPWVWVYVITYFTFVHSMFILAAVWALVRAWAGQRVFRD